MAKEWRKFLTEDELHAVDDVQDTSGKSIVTNKVAKLSKAAVGLGNADNTADKDKTVKEAGKATNDGSGNNIEDTYATKSETVTKADAQTITGDKTFTGNTKAQLQVRVGRDTSETGTMYFKVASVTLKGTYQHAGFTAFMNETDSSYQAQVNVKCSTAKYGDTPNVYVGISSSFGPTISNTTYWYNRIFVVGNYSTDATTAESDGCTFEVWYKTTAAYEQTIFTILSQTIRSSAKFPWTFYNNITTASGTTDFTETSATGRIVAKKNWVQDIVNVSETQEITGAKTFTGGLATNDLQPTTDQSVGIGSADKRFGNAFVSGEVNVYNKSAHRVSLIDTGIESGTKPTSTRMGQTIYYDKNKVPLSAWRGTVTTDGKVRADLYARSFGTNYANYVAFMAEPNATSSSAANTWHFIPNLTNVHDLGYSSWRWKNGYITNLQYVKVINGGGGNALIQQNSDTSGADITVGSDKCNLKLQGKAERPTYRQGTDSYSNLALQSDIPAIPYDGNGLSTGTLGGTTYFTSQGRLYFEKTVGLSVSNDISISGVLVAGCDLVVPIFNGSAINIARVRWDSKEIESGLTVKTVYYPDISLYTTSGSVVSNTSITTGTFKYKVLRSS